jgi:hypothetical protein
MRALVNMKLLTPFLQDLYKAVWLQQKNVWRRVRM